MKQIIDKMFYLPWISKQITWRHVPLKFFFFPFNAFHYQFTPFSVNQEQLAIFNTCKKCYKPYPISSP